MRENTLTMFNSLLRVDFSTIPNLLQMKEAWFADNLYQRICAHVDRINQLADLHLNLEVEVEANPSDENTAESSSSSPEAQQFHN
jgi:hypothetical protein